MVCNRRERLDRELETLDRAIIACPPANTVQPGFDVTDFGGQFIPIHGRLGQGIQTLVG